MNIKRSMNIDTEKIFEAAIGILKLKNGIYTGKNWSEKIKKTPFQIQVLQEVYKISEFPSTGTRKDLSILLGIPQRSIQVWFQNTRQAKRKNKDFVDESNILNNTIGETENDTIPISHIFNIVNKIRRHSMIK